VASILLLLLLGGTVVVSLLSIAASIRYRAVHPPSLADPLPVSVLKPLYGLDNGLESNLRTFFEQDYADFEIVFAMRGPSDPAAAVVEKLQHEYPHVSSRVIFTGEPPYANAKVHSLDAMLRASAHELVVMSDSDVRVTPQLLHTLAAEFQDQRVGVVTCPYRAVPGASLWSQLEATGLNTDFIAGILVARMIEGMRFTVGPTTAARRSVLESIGGFERLKDFLAEDFVMGKLAVEAGFSVVLSSYVIEHHIGDAGLRSNAAHRLRWLRSTRRSRPVGYIGQLLTMPAPFAGLLCVVAPEWWPAALVAWIMRTIAAYVVSARVLHAKIDWLLLPVEDLIAFGFWVAGFFGNTIVWRGRRYRLQPDGRFASL